MRKLVSVLLTLAVVLGLSLTMAVPVAAADVGPGESIQAAIDSATDGDTIIVSDGTYIGDLTVNTPNLTLKSENGSGVTTIQGVDDYVIELDAGADGFTLGGADGEGFTVLGDATASTVLLETIGPSGVTLSYNTFNTSGNPNMAIAVGAGGAADLTISHNTFELYKDNTGQITGIYFDTGDVTNLVIDSNTFNRQTSTPKWLQWAQNAYVDGAMISNNIVNRANVAIRMVGRTNTFNNVTFSGNTIDGGYIAIGPSGAGSISLITNLSISGNSFTGPAFEEVFFEILGSVPSTLIDWNTLTVNNNNFDAAEGEYAIKNGISGTMLDAENNWWGAVSGPYNEATNLQGKGAGVSDNVDYTPWLTGKWTGTSVGLTVDVPDITAISVDPTNIDYGTLVPGQTSSEKVVTVTNIGTHPVDVDAWVTVTSSDLFRSNLKLVVGTSWATGPSWADVITDLVRGDSEGVRTHLVVPSDYAPSGTETGTLTFIGRAA